MVDVRRELAEAQARRPLSELKAAIADAVPVRSFKAALQSGFGLIAEIKDRSPSHGTMRRENVDRAAVAYEQSPVVHAASVLTNAAHFGMSRDRLRQVKLAMTKPVLRKDFIFDDYQVYEARAFGADAILLMANLLDRAEMKRLYQLARALGMSALFECHNLEQIRQVPVDAEIYGINSRTFDSSAARYSVSTLMGKLGAKRDFTIESERFELGRHLPAAAIKVAESGVTPATVARLRDELHYDAALVGTSLLTAGRGIEAELRAFEAALNAQGTASCNSTTSTAKNV
jgi:indole-3-glycerol phosphate synthase